MFGIHSQKQLFQERLAQALREYMPLWEKGDLDLGVATKTLRRWIEGSNSPNDGSMKAFLDAAIHIREDFPRESILEAYQGTRNGKQYGSLEQDGLFGSDAYDRRFSEWCAQATRDSSLVIFQNWLLYPMKFTDEFVYAVENGATARMLLLHPKSQLVTMRYLTTGLSPFSYLAYLEDMPKIIRNLGLDTRPNFSLRFYEALPPFAAYVVDDNILFAPFWARHTTSEGPHLVMSRNSAFGRTAVEDVEFLWRISPELTMDQALAIFTEALELRKREHFGER